MDYARTEATAAVAAKNKKFMGLKKVRACVRADVNAQVVTVAAGAPGAMHARVWLHRRHARSFPISFRIPRAASFSPILAHPAPLPPLQFALVAAKRKQEAAKRKLAEAEEAAAEAAVAVQQQAAVVVKSRRSILSLLDVELPPVDKQNVSVLAGARTRLWTSRA